MERKTLTNRVVADLKNPGPRTLYVYDRECTGFCVAISGGGAKSWYWYGRSRGQPRRIRLGPFPEMNTTDARKAARAKAVQAASGKDVAAEKRFGRRTLGELFAFYLTVHAKLHKRTWLRDEREYELYLSRWNRRPIAEITRTDVGDLIATLIDEHGRGSARKARALLSKMFNVGIAHDWTDRNPVVGTARPSFQPRDRYLRPDEVEAFFEAVDGLKRQTSKDLLLLALYTGARRANVASMRWDELDLNRATWTIPALKKKNNKTQTIPLIQEAMAILRRREKERTSTPWVLPGFGKTGHITEPKAVMEKVRAASGLTDLRFHDLRRSLGAWQNDGGTSTRLIQVTLGHGNIATTAASYTPTETEAVRTEIGRAVDSMFKAAGRKSR